MTTFSLLLTVLAVGVQSGWAPIESPDKSASKSPANESYEYVLQITPGDLEAIRSGQAADLKSNFPEDVGPFDRVRIVFGEKPLARKLSKNDARSPRRLAAGGPERHTVSKPVIPATWESVPAKGDAESSESDTASDPQRQTVYQNGDFLPSYDELRKGFQDGTAPLTEAGQQATRRTKEGFQNLNDNLRQGTQNTLNGASDMLGGTVPAAAEQPLTPSYNYDRVAPPAPAYQTRPNQSAVARTNNNLQTNNQPTPAPPLSFPNEQNRSATNNNSLALPPPPTTTRDDFSAFGSSGPELRNAGDGIAQGFGRSRTPSNDQGYNTSQGYDSYAPVERGRLKPIGQSNDYNNSATPRENDSWKNNNYDRQFAGDSSFSNNQAPRNDLERPSFPATTPTAYGDNNSQRTVGNQNNPGANLQQAQNSGPSGWVDQPPLKEFDKNNTSQQGQTSDNQQTTNQQTAGVAASDMWETLLLVGLAGLNVFLWLSYIDTRHKYRSVLRRNPGGYDHNLAA
jgi:hypothetical protein